jgi:exopolysaccharide production protein ExoZ
MEGLRGFAVFLVFLVHWHAVFSGYCARTTLSFQLSEYGSAIGNVGVDLFFILSGYLIYGGILRKRMGLGEFLFRRFKRIYPAFICVLAIYLVLSLCEPSIAKVSLHESHVLPYLVENLFLLPGMLPIVPIVTVAWSLSYEVYFYVSLPITVSFLGMRNWPVRCRVMLLSVGGLAYAAMVGIGYSDHVRMLMFVAGMLLYETITGRYLNVYLGAIGEFATIGMFVLALHFAALIQLKPDELSILPGLPNWLPVYRTLTLAVAGALFTFYSFNFDGLLNRAFSFAPLRWLGNMSYSYYLTHGLALHVFATFARWALPRHTNVALGFWFLLVPAFLFTLVASAILFVLVETPLSLTRSVTHVQRRAATFG